MAQRARRTGQRSDALSKQRIIEMAIDILDAEGEAALTFRRLAARLATGSGAIYWHVADKDDLLAAATSCVVAGVMDGVVEQPRDAIRAIAMRVFDAIEAHPWVGTQLSREPGQPAALKIFESIGGRLEALGVPQRAQFDTWSALVNYILGVAVQNAANARRCAGDANRILQLNAIAAGWAQLDPAEFPFLHDIAKHLPGHDDREQFLAGIDLILAGIETAR